MTSEGYDNTGNSNYPIPFQYFHPTLSNVRDLGELARLSNRLIEAGYEPERIIIQVDEEYGEIYPDFARDEDLQIEYDRSYRILRAMVNEKIQIERFRTDDERALELMENYISDKNNLEKLLDCLVKTRGFTSKMCYRIRQNPSIKGMIGTLTYYIVRNTFLEEKLETSNIINIINESSRQLYLDGLPELLDSRSVILVYDQMPTVSRKNTLEHLTSGSGFPEVETSFGSEELIKEGLERAINSTHRAKPNGCSIFNLLGRMELGRIEADYSLDEMFRRCNYNPSEEEINDCIERQRIEFERRLSRVPAERREIPLRKMAVSTLIRERKDFCNYCVSAFDNVLKTLNKIGDDKNEW